MINMLRKDPPKYEANKPFVSVYIKDEECLLKEAKGGPYSVKFECY